MATERASNTILKKIVNIFAAIIVVLLQLFVYYIAFFAFSKEPLVLVIVGILGLISVIYLYNTNNNSSYKLSWTIFILLVPFSGTICYLLFANGQTLPKKRHKKMQKYSEKYYIENNVLASIKDLDLVGYKHASLVNKFTKMTPFNNTNSTFFADAKDKTIKMFEDMKNAKKYIYIEFFIISEGKLLDELLEILYEKAACGINVKIIFDDVGSRQTMSKKKVKEINKHQNIEMVSYNPLGVDLSLGVNFRDHRKIVIIDGEIGYTGGDNIADEYVHNIIRFGTWRDNAIRIEGDAVYNLLVMFVENWYMSTLKQIEIDHYIPNDKIVNTAIHFPFGDGPTNQNNPAYNLIKSMISNSHKYLYISTPYFIIDSEFIEEICLAANSGVDVKILVPHIPDKKIIFTLTRSHYGKLLKAGCEIYEYLPGFNHAKNIICDDLYALIGTINIDYRSLFLHFECGDLMMYDQQIHEMKKDFLDAIGKSTRISYETWINRPLRSKIIEFLATIASPLI